MKTVNRHIKAYILASVALSVAVFNFGFNLGAFKTIFFNELFTVWVINLAVLFACLLLPQEDRPVDGWGMWALATPTIWLILSVIQIQNESWSFLDELVFVIGLIVLFITLPYVTYILISITQEETLRIKPRRLLYQLVLIAVAVELVGFFIGRYNHLVLNCEDFKLAGYDQPAQCYDG